MPENLFQSGAENAKPLIRKGLFCSHANKTLLHKKGFSLSFALLKVRVFGTRIWPIKVRVREDCLIVSRGRMNFELTTFLQSTEFFFCFLSSVFSSLSSRMKGPWERMTSSSLDSRVVMALGYIPVRNARLGSDALQIFTLQCI